MDIFKLINSCSVFHDCLSPISFQSHIHVILVDPNNMHYITRYFEYVQNLCTSCKQLTVKKAYGQPWMWYRARILTRELGQFADWLIYLWPLHAFLLFEFDFQTGLSCESGNLYRVREDLRYRDRPTLIVQWRGWGTCSGHESLKKVKPHIDIERKVCMSDGKMI